MIPFTHDTAQSIAALGEVRLIARIREWLGDTSAPPPRGIGDDCAVFPAPPPAGDRLVTTDSVIWGRHFDASVPPHAVGAKLIKRNLSDIAAMGGQASDAVLSLVTGPDVAINWLAEFFQGIADTCRQYRVELAGGDIAAAPAGFFCATLSLTGFATNPLQRLSARVGDVLLVTGSLGGSLLGKHHAFTPRLDEGRWLAGHPAVRAGMDITDGLSKDIPAMLPDGTDARLDLKQIPIAEDARRLSNTDGQSALTHALDDGEDYELLIAAEPLQVERLLRDWNAAFPKLALTPIGVIAPANDTGGKLIDQSSGQPLDASHHGYTHF